eukprot:1578635-Pleurochrysis_carterae.AAC.1
MATFMRLINCAQARQQARSKRLSLSWSKWRPCILHVVMMDVMYSCFAFWSTTYWRIRRRPANMFS